MRKCVRMDFKFVGDWIQAFGSVILSILTSKRKSQSLDGSRRRRTQRKSLSLDGSRRRRTQRWLLDLVISFILDFYYVIRLL
ncbi:hypothetical protein V6Z12_A06G163400 [Gossypium hirsutum]